VGRKAGSQQGFTLLELAVVVLILSVATALAFPVIQSLGSGNLKLTARHLVRAVYFLSNRAVATKRIYRLNYDLKEQAYWVTTPTGEGEFSPVAFEGLARTGLLGTVQFMDVETLHQGKVTEGKAYTDFYPMGRVEKTTLHLTDEAKNILTLVFNPVTGRVKVYEGYMEEAGK